MQVSALVICRNKEILKTMIRLIDGEYGWYATGAISDEEAMGLFSFSSYNIVLFGSGVDLKSIEVLSKEFQWINPSIKIVTHYGGGSGLLFGEIHEAFRK